MIKSFWKVPLYCMIASWICFQLEIRLGRFAVITLPDGSVTADNTRWLIMSGILFIAIIAIGSILFFRNMTRKEIFYSASVLVAINVIVGLISYKIQGMFAFYWAELSEWDTFIVQLLWQANINPLIISIVSWILPYIFMIFGKKSIKE